MPSHRFFGYLRDNLDGTPNPYYLSVCGLYESAIGMRLLYGDAHDETVIPCGIRHWYRCEGFLTVRHTWTIKALWYGHLLNTVIDRRKKAFMMGDIESPRIEVGWNRSTVNIYYPSPTRNEPGLRLFPWFFELLQFVYDTENEQEYRQNMGLPDIKVVVRKQ